MNSLRSLIAVCVAFHGAPLLALSSLVFATWAIGDLGDGSSLLAVLLIAAIFLMFAIHIALLTLGS